MKKSESTKSDFQYSTLFAAGEVYISSIIDTLTAQAYYNPNIVTILQQILVGRSETFHGDFENQVVQYFGEKVSTSNLWQIIVPEEQVNKTYDKLFKFLLEKGLVTLGLYRLSGATDNSYPYVYTNPSQNRKTKLIVTQKDRVFVLGKDIPKELIIDYSSKQVNKQQANFGEGQIPLKKSTDSEKNSQTTRDFYGIKQISESKHTVDGGSNPSNRSSLIKEGGSATNSHNNNKQALKHIGSKQVKFQDADLGSPATQVSKPMEFPTNPPSTTQVASGSTSTIDYMRKAVINLNTRVQDIEKKISKVEGILNGQQKVIRNCV